MSHPLLSLIRSTIFSILCRSILLLYNLYNGNNHFFWAQRHPLSYPSGPNWFLTPWTRCVTTPPHMLFYILILVSMATQDISQLVAATTLFVRLSSTLAKSLLVKLWKSSPKRLANSLEAAGFWWAIALDRPWKGCRPSCSWCCHQCRLGSMGQRWEEARWQSVAEFTPEQFVDAIDFRYLTDAITPEEAIELLRKSEPGNRNALNWLRKTKLSRLHHLRRLAGIQWWNRSVCYKSLLTVDIPLSSLRWVETSKMTSVAWRWRVKSLAMMTSTWLWFRRKPGLVCSWGHWLR